MSKNKFITASMAQLMKFLVGGKLFAAIIDLVRKYADIDAEGVVKKQQVTRELNEVKSEFFVIVHSMSGWMISVAIDAAHAYIAVREKQ